MPNLPLPHDFYLATPVYDQLNITKLNYGDIVRILYYQGPLDAFCPGCDRESVFSGTRELPNVGPGLHFAPPESIDELIEYEEVWIADDGSRSYSQRKLQEYILTDKTIINKFVCSRDASHTLEFVLKTEEAVFQKIGQYPSMADLQKSNIKKYRKLLGGEKSSEFTRATGLAAHGVGIGSFVYLRRIFESLIEAAHAEARGGSGWSDETYYKSRMDEKILLLKDFLPAFLVENRSIYSVLSIGVHELTEQECLEYFEPVKLAIEIILDEKLEKLQKEEKESMTKKALAAIKTRLGGR